MKLGELLGVLDWTGSDLIVKDWDTGKEIEIDFMKDNNEYMVMQVTPYMNEYRIVVEVRRMKKW